MKRSPPARTRAERRSQARRTERVTRYQAVWTLRQAGVCQAAIADQLGLHRDTVRKYLRHSVFPERVVRPARPRRLDEYKP